MLSLRTTLISAAVLFGAHGVVLAVYGHPAPGPVLSSLVQLGLGILCVLATLTAARTAGSPFERRFLRLVAARYLIFSLAQALACYYELVFHGHWEFEGSPSDILFHLEDVPLGIAFFLDPGREGTHELRPHPLDLAQIGVFWTAVALYVRFLIVDVPVGVGLVAATDALVAGCFYLRAMTSRSSIASALFGRWTPAILLSTVNDAYSGFYDSNAGEFFDLIWSTESLVWIVTAATWRRLAARPGADASRTVDRTVTLLPLVVACFSVVLSLGLAQRRLGMALGLLAAVLACSSDRLLRLLRPLGGRAPEGEGAGAPPAGTGP
jgi:hypothetical protein